MTITIAFDSDSPSKLRELAKFINELANIAEGKELNETNEKEIDDPAELVVADRVDDTTAPVSVFPRPWKNVEKIVKNELPNALDAAEQYFKTPEAVEQDESASNELDASGLPWDARLHSRTKSKTTDGLWRKQRGLSPSKANRLELEIRASVTDAQKIAYEESKPVAPPPPPFTSAQTPPPPPAPTEDEYISLVKKITTAVETEKLSYEKVKDVLMQFGIDDLVVLKNVPHLYAVIDQQIGGVLCA